MKLISTVFFLFICFAINGQKTVDSEVVTTDSVTAFEFDKTFIDLGAVTKGEKKIFAYEMTNTGKSAIEISYLDYCACTEVDYPEGKILKPGESMVFDVTFDSTEKDEKETIEISVELKNIDPSSGLPYFFTLDYQFNIVK